MQYFPCLREWELKPCKKVMIHHQNSELLTCMKPVKSLAILKNIKIFQTCKMQTEYTLQPLKIRGVSLQFDTFQTLNHDKGEREICHLGFK